jgi:cell division protein FtsL
MASQPQEPSPPPVVKGESVVLTGMQVILIVTFVPIVIAFLVLAVRIIWSATSNPEVLTNIEGLLAAMAILSSIVSGGMGYVFAGVIEEIKVKRKGGGD